MSTVECLVCGHVGAPKTKGSFVITIILLFIGFLPGLIYEVWRRSGGKVCSACGSQSVKLYKPQARISQQSVREAYVEPVQSKETQTKLVATDMFAHNAGVKAKSEEKVDDVEFKACPFCAEQIRVSAIKCKHCGSMLESN